MRKASNNDRCILCVTHELMTVLFYITV